MKKALIAMAFVVLEELLADKKVPAEYQDAIAKLYWTILTKKKSDAAFAKKVDEAGVTR